jgi:hypothetical protein
VSTETSEPVASPDPQQTAVHDADEEMRYCGLPPQPVRALPSDLDPGRAAAILEGATKWVDGTVLHYYFFDRGTDGSTVRLNDRSTRFVSWVGAAAQQDVVRESFQHWKDLGIGLEFREVTDRSEAEVRIGFLNDFDGSWSYVGRDVLQQGQDARTMNFGWDLTTPYGHTTALHEIGHTLGMPHEHQNPFSGIVWDEERVYSYFAGPPNSWSRDKTFNNVLRKLSPTEVTGSTWDPDSIMEYGFPPGLIRQPARYHEDGIRPPGTVSPLDNQYILTWYPAMKPQTPTLAAFESRPLHLGTGEQADFELRPPGTRQYSIGAFGASDVVLVLFEDVDGELRYVKGDDDSGEDGNALLKVKLFQGRRYVVRVRLYIAWQSGETALMYW